MAVTRDPVTPIGQFHIIPRGNESIGFGDQHSGQHSTGAFAGKFAQGIINRVGLSNRMTVVSLDMVYRSFLEVLAGSHPPRSTACLKPSSPRFGHSSI
jgi:hypothetical protein